MTTIDIYDIAGNKWYQQSAPGGPPGLTQGCAVVAPAQDHSSYNIYYYGGFDGLDDTANFNDDVWILSLPSFMWMKVSSGSADHGRAGHKCVMPYPDQMITIGGGPPQGGRTAPCLAPLANTPTKTNLIEVFNLTEGKWMESYDPTKWSKYGVPQMIHLMIGGDYDGGATMTTPSPSGWADDGLASVFSHSYDMSKITTHYPYNPATPTDNTNSSAQPPDATPNWLAPVLGVVLGLVFVTAVAVAILLYRRRRLLRRNGGAASGGTDDDGHRILSWIRGQTSDKAPTVTTDDTPATEELESHSTPGPYQQQRYQQLQQNHQHGSPRAQAGGAPAMRELQSTPLVELWGKWDSINHPPYLQFPCFFFRSCFGHLD